MADLPTAGRRPAPIRPDARPRGAGHTFPALFRCGSLKVEIRGLADQVLAGVLGAAPRRSTGSRCRHRACVRRAAHRWSRALSVDSRLGGRSGCTPRQAAVRGPAPARPAPPAEATASPPPRCPARGRRSRRWRRRHGRDRWRPPRSCASRACCRCARAGRRAASCERRSLRKREQELGRTTSRHDPRCRSDVGREIMSLARRSGAVIGAETDVAEAIGALPWGEIEGQLDERGYAVVGPLLSVEECRSIAALYDDRKKFRSRVVMASHGFGSGEYQYFSYPLPPAVEAMREAVYARLVPVANRWYGAMGMESGVSSGPRRLSRSVPRRRADAAHAAPAALSRGRSQLPASGPLRGPGLPHSAGRAAERAGRRFHRRRVSAREQRPRRQSRPEVVPLAQGQGVIFAVSQRPVTGTRGSYRVTMRHGVSRVRSACVSVWA